MRPRLLLAFCGWAGLCLACSKIGDALDPGGNPWVPDRTYASLEIFNCQEDAQIVVYRQELGATSWTRVGSAGATRNGVGCDESNAGSVAVQLIDGVINRIRAYNNPGPSANCEASPDPTDHPSCPTALDRQLNGSDDGAAGTEVLR